MKHPRLARLATDLLAEESLAKASPPPDVEARAVAAIAGAIERRARQRRRARLTIGLSLAAGVLAALGFAARERSQNVGSAAMPLAEAPEAPPSAIAAPPEPEPAPSVARTEPTAARSQSGLAIGDRVRAAESGPTGLVLADGSRLLVDRRSDVSVTSLSSTRRFLLTEGAVRADVKKLSRGERFVVETADAEVEVHGTSFRVALAAEPSPCSESLTRVRVFEGVVTVRFHGVEARLVAGQDWPQGCKEAAVPAGAPATAAPPAASAASASTTAPPTAGTAMAARTSSALAEQNRLFAEATAARHRGDTVAALALYDRLLTLYPDGVLAESVAVERMRTLGSVDRGRARDAARAYLARHPQGFARAEAEELARR